MTVADLAITQLSPSISSVWLLTSTLFKSQARFNQSPLDEFGARRRVRTPFRGLKLIPALARNGTTSFLSFLFLVARFTEPSARSFPTVASRFHLLAQILVWSTLQSPSFLYSQSNVYCCCDFQKHSVYVSSFKYLGFFFYSLSVDQKIFSREVHLRLLLCSQSFDYELNFQLTINSRASGSLAFTIEKTRPKIKARIPRSQTEIDRSFVCATDRPDNEIVASSVFTRAYPLESTDIVDERLVSEWRRRRVGSFRGMNRVSREKGGILRANRRERERERGHWQDHFLRDWRSLTAFTLLVKSTPAKSVHEKLPSPLTADPPPVSC